MDDLQDLLKELEDIKERQKALLERESLCKADIMEIMKDSGLEKEEGPHGSVRLQRRYEKNYGDEVRTLEIELKELKKLKEDMGDFVLMGFKESIVYNSPKD